MEVRFQSHIIMRIAYQVRLKSHLRIMIFLSFMMIRIAVFKHKESTRTKGITKFFIGAALFAGIATADTDLFAKLSNGAMSDKDAGIAELTLEEKKQIRGGMYYVEPTLYVYAPNRTGLLLSCDYGCTDNESRWYQQGVRAGFERIVLVTTYQTKLNGQEYYTHEFHITNKMENKGKLYRQVWGKVTEEMLQQYRMVAEDLNRRYRY
ncbi:MAG: hypothetical protein K2N12_05205 [Helicobacter sp.]|nr:hypothetical protein [Helicobacter sp.]